MEKDHKKRVKQSAALALMATLTLGAVGASEKATPLKTVQIADGMIDPAKWGKAYPVEYDMWKKTGVPTPVGKSKYKKGNDGGVTYDKLSEFPFLALLFNGWGMGVEYNEPRGHLNMRKDQSLADPSRLKSGGVCLTCKTPYAVQLEQKMGKDYYSKLYDAVLAEIPKEHQDLGVACIDCHDNKDMSLQLSRGFTLGKALKAMGVDETKLTHQDKRSLVCAQCHVTYTIPKDADMKSADVFFPWEGSTWGQMPVENIIKKIRSDASYGEWKQGVTGFKMAFIRHPEFEMYSNNSVHWKAGVSCADCHMPYTKVGSQKATDHRVMSPLKNDMKACQQCHTQTPEWLKEQVLAIQDRAVSIFIRSGYATATVAKLFEMAHKAQAEGKEIKKDLYAQAKDHYEEAFYRVIYFGAENSVGFHNPTEAMRVLGDAALRAGQAEALLRQGLTAAGIAVPAKIDLELSKYLNNRGVKKLMFNPGQEIIDPFTPRKTLRSKLR